MTRAGIVRFMLISVLAGWLQACGSDDPEPPSAQIEDEDVELPSRYGLYALQDEKFGRIDGDRDYQIATWEGRSALTPEVTFLLFDRALGDRSVRLQDAVKLRRLAHLRNDVSESGAVEPTTKDVWVAADLPEFSIPLDFAPVSGNAEMVRVVPSKALPPGLYALELRHGGSAVGGRFGVQWGGADRKEYVASNCVDRYAGKPAKYRLCSDGPPQSAATASKPSWSTAPAQNMAAPLPQGLELRQVQADKSTDRGMPILTVQGVIVNTTDRVQPVPQLEAVIRDPQGAELDRWTFAAELLQLQPGASTGFRTETIYPTSSSTNVAVTFLADRSQ